MNLYAESKGIIVDFKGKKKLTNITVPLDSVYVLNLSKNVDTVLKNSYSLYLGIEVNHLQSPTVAGFSVHQNYPNPFNGETNIRISVTKNQLLTLSVFNIYGQQVAVFSDEFMKGDHFFRFAAGQDGIFILVAGNGSFSNAIKLINNCNHQNNFPKLSYEGSSATSDFKADILEGKFLFEPGDQMKYTGFASGYANNSIYDTPSASKTYTFEFVDPYYQLYSHYVETQIPCFVNIMFSAEDEAGKGVDNLFNQDFEVFEDQTVVSPTETFRYIKKNNTLPYRIKTVLLLDNSASVSNNIGEIKNAAKALVSDIAARQEFAICVFSSEMILLQDFTSDVDSLIMAINSIEVGFATTNLYGAVIEAVGLWNDAYSSEYIQQGFLVVFTDGDDTQGSYTLQQAVNARGSKKAYMVGLGDELNPEPLNAIANPGPYYPISNVTQLENVFGEIQYDIIRYANSFYWLIYMSPKRQGIHDLELHVIGNLNTGSHSFIESSFNANSFFDVGSGVFVNTSAALPYGVDTILLYELEEIDLKSVTYWAYHPPDYSWSVSSEQVAVVEVDGYDNSMATLNFTEDGGETLLTVFDESNQYSKEIILIGEFSPPVADFSADPANGEAPLNVQFTDLSTQNPTSWQWNFGDGSSSDEQNPAHIYNNPGIYTVQLTVTNSHGTDIEEKVDYIVAEGAPIAQFAGEPSGGPAPLSVNFTDLSANNPTAWEWEFGDGAGSTEQNPSHTYQNQGAYTVKLTVSNAFGTNFKEKYHYINVSSGGGSGEPCPGIPTVNYEGQIYSTILVGQQCWLKENLNVGTMIPGDKQMSDNDTIEKYCYENDPSNCALYGGVYSWDEIMQYTSQQASQGICPPGWHIPTDEEWKELEGEADSLYGYPDPEWNGLNWRGFNAGLNLKYTDGWNSGGNGSDLHGFAGLPGGSLYFDGYFFDLGSIGYWWTSTESGSDNAIIRALKFDKDEVFRYGNVKEYGFSIRCIKN